MFIEKLKERVQHFPLLSAFALGLLGALSFEPTRNFITLLFSLWGFIYVLENSAHKKDFLKRYVAYLYGYYLLNFYWIQLSFVSIDQYAIIPLAILSFPLIFCLFSMIFAFLPYHFIKKKSFPILVGLTLFLNELIIGHAFTGFPWTLTAYCLNDYLMQGGAYVGAYGMSFLTLLFLTATYKADRKKQILLLGVYICANALGAFRLMQNPALDTSTTLRIVHPDVAQSTKLNPHQARETLDKHIALSTLKGDKALDIVVWPECIVPYPMNKLPDLIDLVKDAVPENGYLITGAPKEEDDQRIYTSAYILNDKGVIESIYDKMHLVPFGEYLPLRHLLAHFGIDKMTQGSRDYTPGKARPCYNFKNIPAFNILICYEIIFPSQLIEEDRPQWMLNLTNDAWYLRSSGPYQHFHIVRWRAIEEGLPIIRCANKGISAIIDPLGRVRSSLKIGAIGVIDGYIPKCIERTWYSKAIRFVVSTLTHFLKPK
ncbi:MAG: Apolipoprotein N-acyltransferase [Holosporales bacterium]